MAALAAQAGMPGAPPGVDLASFGSPPSAITTTVDVRAYEMWGDEPFIRRGAHGERSLFVGIDSDFGTDKAADDLEQSRSSLYENGRRK